MSFTSRIKSYTRWKWKIFRITFLSLFYNEHFSSDYAFDTLMQPAFWFVDQFTAVLGPAFVSLVIVLTVGINENFPLEIVLVLLQTSVVFIVYWIGLPYYLEYKNIYQLWGE